MPAVLQQNLPDLTGKVLANGFVLLEVLGSGTWGTVYKALDTRSQSEEDVYYAVKCLRIPAKWTYDEDLMLREIRHHSAVSGHPNVVAYHRTLYDIDYAYLILDLCAGGDLFTSIVKRDAFLKNTDKIKAVFLQVLDAVEHCHSVGVFHRDLKPENILCSEDGLKVYLADFGLATKSPWCCDYRIGSWEYMSPDCIGKEFGFNDKQYSTRRNDLWALGVVLINMITKRAPWKSAVKTDACFSAFLQDEDYFLRVLPISEDINKLLARIFALDPVKRISLSEMRTQVMAIDSFFPPGIDDVKGDIQPIRADDTSPRNSACIERTPTTPSVAPALSLGLGGMLRMSVSFIAQIAGPGIPAIKVEVYAEEDEDGLSFLDFDDSLSSGSSDGPITPATYATEVADDIEVVSLVAWEDILKLEVDVAEKEDECAIDVVDESDGEAEVSSGTKKLRTSRWRRGSKILRKLRI